MKLRNLVLTSAMLVGLGACMSGQEIRDVDFPATPIDMSKVNKKGKACFVIGAMGTTSGSASIIQAAKNGGITTVRMVEYSEEFENGGLTRKKCTTVYGD